MTASLRLPAGKTFLLMFHNLKCMFSCAIVDTICISYFICVFIWHYCCIWNEGVQYFQYCLFFVLHLSVFVSIWGWLAWRPWQSYYIAGVGVGVFQTSSASEFNVFFWRESRSWALADSLHSWCRCAIVNIICISNFICVCIWRYLAWQLLLSPGKAIT